MGVHEKPQQAKPPTVKEIDVLADDEVDRLYHAPSALKLTASVSRRTHCLKLDRYGSKTVADLLRWRSATTMPKINTGFSQASG
jgi:hypothetical protein